MMPYKGWGSFLCMCNMTSLVAQLRKSPAMQQTCFPSLGWEDPIEKEMAIPSSVPAWGIPWREEPGWLQSIGSQRVGHNWATNTEKAMAPYSSTLAWKIPWTEEPGRLQSVHGVAKSRTWLSDFTFIFHFHALEEEMATHSSILAWRIPGTGEPGGPVCGVTHSGTQLKRLSSSSSSSSSRATNNMTIQLF